MNTSSSQTSSQQLTDSNFNDSQFPSSIQHPESSDQDRAPSAFTNPETAPALDAIIQRRIPHISLNRACPLDCALELFFACPEELAAFGISTSPPERSDVPIHRDSSISESSSFSSSSSSSKQDVPAA